MEASFCTDWGKGSGFWMIQMHYVYCAFHFYFYYISSLVAQMVKNLSTMQETCDRFLDAEDTLEEGMATQSSILP